MTARDREELHKLLDRIIDEEEHEGTYQSIIANIDVEPFEVTYDKFYCKIYLDLRQFRI